jgi:outer membrane protein assembly factor BamA
MQLQSGYIFNIEAGKRALRNVNSLGLFANIEVNPRPDEENDGGIVVEIKLKELEQKTAEVSTEWSIAPGGSGWPSLVCIQCALCSFFLKQIQKL